MDENKELLELVKQIEKTNRQQSRSARLMCILALITAACCVAVFLLIFNFLPQVNSVVTQMQVVLGNLEQTTGQLAALDLEGMISGVDTLVATGQEGLEQTMEKLNSIDLDTLNQAIDDLAAVVQPLAKLTNMFK